MDSLNDSYSSNILEREQKTFVFDQIISSM